MNCKVYAFFKAIRGNWRNAIYVSCEQATCPYGHHPACTGYLLATNEYGHPLVISEADYIRLKQTNAGVRLPGTHLRVCMPNMCTGKSILPGTVLFAL